MEPTLRYLMNHGAVTKEDCAKVIEEYDKVVASLVSANASINELRAEVSRLSLIAKY
jgi:hypothetical protein